ncbi:MULTISPECIES: nitrous oxide reductase family maturation protein NosD [unclassified Streptomyces]|uniref:right-handed parallel beta-helix repeat-containing protein n=1 Tax=unclassified Streptomyces TaxID=2593676 RepID=UPI001F033725|nr:MULTISPECIES: right-handed parallel beta-helix repeat-containing protein [unclassified Streptomyces]MCH0563038.1 right-handed parallel beta-helix repeat-containing protein [Streptomyces sp. MUM 2J]MCH0573288.1 right-handed parallel beta-helix repeat-containing protein [Streptomyces sp. MUM 136J]
MTKRLIAYLACTAALLVAGLGAAAPASARPPAHPGHPVPSIHVVRSGQSIQNAVDAAAEGDTVLVLPGTYRESVKVTTPGLTLRGVGGHTVIVPGTDMTPGSCAARGNGICVMGAKDRAVPGVTVADLTVTGFPGTGVFALATDRLTVRNVTAAENGVWGIALEHSLRAALRHNTARDNGDAGLFLANTVRSEEGAEDTRGTVVEHNLLRGNRIGVTVRRLRNLTVAGNHITANCAGVFVVGDENTPKAGDLTVRGNHIVRNNRSCPKTARLPALQGTGIVLTGAEQTLVTRNEIRDNAGTSPLSGGIVLFKSFVGATNDDNRVTGNTLDGNAPADLVDTDPGRSNTFEDNTCRASLPAGLC